jgi:Tfp pilus assembly protein PilF
MTQQEEPLFKAGITALQAGQAELARASFQSAIDASVAAGRSYLGLALACLAQSDLPAAEAAIDNTLKLEPANLRAIIMKGDIVFARTRLLHLLLRATAALVGQTGVQHRRHCL